jgi:hypothetical protein
MILIDSHVHIYPCFHLGRFFSAAYENFASASPSQGCNGFVGVLLLAETAREHVFEELVRDADCRSSTGAQTDPWIVHRTRESCSLRLTDPNGRELILVSGRQVVTAENLEVLGLMTTQMIPDGLPVDAVTHRVGSDHGVPVLAWGFGKWTGKRGRIACDAVARNDPCFLCLGDSRGRPWEWPEPKQFRHGRAKGMKILYGTDPLPLTTEEAAAGSLGIFADGEADRDFPARHVRSLLLVPEVQLGTYGRRIGITGFLRCQIGLLIQAEKNGSGSQ